MALKRDSLDAVFSDLVREIWDWTCVRCSRPFPERKGRDVHASHFYSRTFNSTRWFIDNALCLCAACHDHVGKHPDDHTALIKRAIGDVGYEQLRERKQRIVRYRAADKKAMRWHFAQELTRIRQLREGGRIGYVRAANYD